LLLSMDVTVCNYKNTTIYGYHLKELNPGQWVNDVLIGFYYEYDSLDSHRSYSFV
jgi:Ulp1 family protease